MKLHLKEYLLELKHPFAISRQTFKTKSTLIVSLTDGIFIGLGEASSNPYYNITIKNMINDLSKVKQIIESIEDKTPEDFWNIIYPHLKNNMFALSALDLAYNDLYAKKKHKKLYELWNLNIENNPLTNYTIGIDTIDNMISKMKETPFPIYKIKLGTSDDLKIIKALRKHTNAIFRVDANCGWTVDETLKNAKEFKALNVEFIEQPLHAKDWIGHKILFKNSVLPIIADESCQIESDVKKCYNHFHGVNIKLTKCGGLTAAKQMIFEAKKLNLKTMVGCMTESSIGISAIAHLAPLLDYIDMDGALLLKKDIAKGIEIKNGKIIYSNKTGLGVELHAPF